MVCTTPLANDDFHPSVGNIPCVRTSQHVLLYDFLAKRVSYELVVVKA
jgi:hypothetical protein